MNKKTICVALGVLSLCGSYANAHGTTSDDANLPSVKIRYGDLNLSSADGGRVMLARIEHAAKTLCGLRPDDPIWRKYEYEPCVRRAINGAVVRLGNPVVAALNGNVSKNPVALASR